MFSSFEIVLLIVMSIVVGAGIVYCFKNQIIQFKNKAEYKFKGDLTSHLFRFIPDNARCRRNEYHQYFRSYDDYEKPYLSRI